MVEVTEEDAEDRNNWRWKMVMFQTLHIGWGIMVTHRMYGIMVKRHIGCRA